MQRASRYLALWNGRFIRQTTSDNIICIEEEEVSIMLKMLLRTCTEVSDGLAGTTQRGMTFLLQTAGKSFCMLIRNFCRKLYKCSQDNACIPCQKPGTYMERTVIK